MTPLALSISSEIKSLGAYAGFAAVVGLALLALLYFAQAREIRRLTEWAGRAPERTAPSVPPSPAAVPPGGPAALGGAVQNIRPAGPARPQVPGQPPAPFVPQPQSQPQVGRPPEQSPGLPGLPGLPGAGSSAVAQATMPGAGAAPGATQALPTAVPPAPAGYPPPARPQPPGPPGYPPAPGGPSPPAAGYPPAASAPYPPAPSFPSLPSVPSAASRLPAAPVPVGVGASRAQPLAGPPSASRPATEAPPRRPPALPPERAAGAPQDGRPSRSRTRPPGRRTLAVVAGAFVILVILVFAVTHLLGGGGGGGGAGSGSPHTSSAPGASSQSPGAPPAPTVVAPSTVTVAVLNGTSVAGLAAKIAKRLQTGGYVKGYVGDAPSKSGAVTSVQYALNEQSAARQVAKALGLSSTAVAPLDPATAAVSPTVSDAQVVVSVGSDLQQ